MKETQVENVKILNKNWMQVDEQEIKDRFDLAVCSHFLWQVNDLEKHLKKMENSRNYCAVIQPAGMGKDGECKNYELQYRKELRARSEIHSEFYR